MKCFLRINFLLIALCVVFQINHVNCLKYDYRIPQPIRDEIDRFKSYMKSSINPCSDLYEFSCSNYGRNVHNVYDGYLKNVPDMLSGKYDNQIKNLLQRPPSSSSSSQEHDHHVNIFERKAQQFYKLCQNSIQNHMRLKQQLLQFIKTLNSGKMWPIWLENNRNYSHSLFSSSSPSSLPTSTSLFGYNTDDRYNVPNEIDWFKILANMKLYNIKPLIDGRIEPFPYNTSGKNFVIECKPKLYYNYNEDRFNPNYIKTYEDQIRRIFLDYGVNYELANRYTKDLINFEKELVKLLNYNSNNYYSSSINDRYYNDNNNNDYGDDIDQQQQQQRDSDDNVEQYQYQKFKTEFWQVNWDNYFETVFGFHKLKDTYLLTVKGGKYLKNILQYIKSKSTTTIANYLFVTIIREFNYLLKPMDMPNFCVYATTNAMNPVISYMYLHKYFNQKIEIDIFDMWKMIKLSHLQVWQKLIQESSYDNYYSYDSNVNITLMGIDRKLNNMRIVFFSDHIDILEKAANTYIHLDIDRTNFLKTYTRFMKHNNLLDIPKDYVRYLIIFSALHKEPKYVYEKNAVIIPQSILQLPYYNYEWSYILKYSKLGYLLSRTVAKAFNKRGRKLDEYGNRHNWWQLKSNITKSIEKSLLLSYYSNLKVLDFDNNQQHQQQQTNDYYNQQQQINNYYNQQQQQTTSNYYYNQPQHQITNNLNSNSKFSYNKNKNDIIEELWSNYFGIKTSHQAYINKLMDFDKIESIPRTGLSTNQTYFVSLSQLLCGEYVLFDDWNSNDHNNGRNGNDNSAIEQLNGIPAKLHINIPMSFIKEYKTSFGCN